MFAVENYFYPLKASRLNFQGFVSILGHCPSIDRLVCGFVVMSLPILALNWASNQGESGSVI